MDMNPLDSKVFSERGNSASVDNISSMLDVMQSLGFSAIIRTCSLPMVPTDVITGDDVVMPRWHESPSHPGELRSCRATLGPCPFAGSYAHIEADNINDAYEAYFDTVSGIRPPRGTTVSGHIHDPNAVREATTLKKRTRRSDGSYDYHVKDNAKIALRKARIAFQMARGMGNNTIGGARARNRMAGHRRLRTPVRGPVRRLLRAVNPMRFFKGVWNDTMRELRRVSPLAPAMATVGAFACIGGILFV